MRYYELDGNGRVRGSYAVPQSGKIQVLLDEAPDDQSKWDGVKWVPDQDIIDAKASREAKAELVKIDQASIRSIREYIAAKADAPKLLKDYETLAAAQRLQIKEPVK